MADTRYASTRGMDLLAAMEALPTERRDELFAIIERLLTPSLHESSRITAAPSKDGDYPAFCVNRTCEPYNPARTMLRRWGFDPDATTPVLALLIREKFRELDVLIERHAQHGESVFHPVGILGSSDAVESTGRDYDAKQTRLRTGTQDPVKQADTLLDASNYGTIRRSAVILRETSQADDEVTL